MSSHSKSKSKPKRPTSRAARAKDRASSPEKLTRALVAAVVDQVVAAFTPEDWRVAGSAPPSLPTSTRACSTHECGFRAAGSSRARGVECLDYCLPIGDDTGIEFVKAPAALLADR
ncbi:MAG TPA: hypothetical protein VK762_32625 [Polyangiaceae bacterium]|jgi:hypothetical protein|nr:hypothetical protein [Polyangiaceae bacterium]